MSPDVRARPHRALGRRRASGRLDGYEAQGGYDGLRTALAMAPHDLIQLVKDSGLRGRGGAGFPTGMKWSFVPQDTGKPTYVTVNFDESEPGHLQQPRARWSASRTGCSRARRSRRTRSDATPRSSTCRGEYLWQAMVLQRAIDEAYAGGYLGSGIARQRLRPGHRAAPRRRRLHLRRGDGAAQLARGLPRPAAPAPAVPRGGGAVRVADRDQQRRDADERARTSSSDGADWFRSQGTEKSPGTKMFTISGKVERPGNYELPLGTPFRVLLEEYAGGMLGRRVAEGVDARRIVDAAAHRRAPRRRPGLRVDRGGRLAAGHRRDHGDGRDRLRRRGRRSAWCEFYAHESCGKCTPCREGTLVGHAGARAGSRTGTAASEDIPLMHEVGANIMFRAFCALADGAVSADLLDACKHFMRRVRGARPAGPVPVRSPACRPASRGGGRLDGRPTQTVTLTIDGKEVTVPAGTLIIRAAEQLGIEIPRFCDHPLLEPVGACRQCYVEIEGQPKLLTSCTTTVAPGMVVHDPEHRATQVHDAQVANLEFLLLNHPLDCPICDRGGECPLQDQALAFGPGREPLRRGQAHLPEADAAVAAGEPRPRALRAVRPVHAVLRPDLGRPVHRAVRPRRRASRSAIARGRGLPLAVQRQHRSRSVRWAR